MNELLIDRIAEGLTRLSVPLSEADACGGDPACVLDVSERAAAIAEEELVGLDRAVAGAELVCLGDAGGYYSLALKRYVLARDFAREGRQTGAPRNATAAAGLLTDAERPPPDARTRSTLGRRRRHADLNTSPGKTTG